jgi:DNA-binding beta-propeller fold protein YncE
MKRARQIPALFVTVLSAILIISTWLACGDGAVGPSDYQAPRNLVGTFGGPGKGVLLEWETSENNEETGYEVWRLGGISNMFAKIGETNKGELGYNDATIIEGQVYKYKVSTVYDGEQGPYSNEVEVDTSGGGGAEAYIWVADKDNAKIYRVDADSGTVDRTFTAPGNKPAGLAWDGSKLWHADFGKVKIYKLNPSTGAVESSFNAPDAGPWGLTWDGSNLWVGDFDALKIYKVNTSGGVVTSFDAPGNKPRGLAWDGSNLWCADNGTNKVYKLNPSNGNVISSFKTPGSGTTGLTSDGTNLWNADKTAKKVYKLDMNGAIISSFNAPGTFPMGLAFQGE